MIQGTSSSQIKNMGRKWGRFNMHIVFPKGNLCSVYRNTVTWFFLLNFTVMCAKWWLWCEKWNLIKTTFKHHLCRHLDLLHTSSFTISNCYHDISYRCRHIPVIRVHKISLWCLTCHAYFVTCQISSTFLWKCMWCIKFSRQVNTLLCNAFRTAWINLCAVEYSQFISSIQDNQPK